MLYNIPDRDCSAGESSGELSLANGGLDRYMEEYAGRLPRRSWKQRISNSLSLWSPTRLPIVTGGDIEACANTAKSQQGGIAYAIQQLQGENIHLYSVH